jgi:putative ABC transport system permease protein
VRLADVLKLALQNLWRTKFRSFLTILGVIIGISAIVAFVSLGVGLQKITSNQVAGLNALTTLTITQTPATSSMEEGPKLNEEAIDKIKKLNNVDSVTPSVNMPANVESTGTSAGAIIYGIDVQNTNLEISGLTFGSLIKDKSSNEAIISSSLAAAFNSNKENVIGKEISIKILKDSAEGYNYNPKELKLKIVGIDNNETSNMVYAPIGKIKDLTQFEKYSTLKVKVASSNDVDLVKDQIKKMGYQVTTIKDLVDQIDKIFLLAEIILGLVGGIGLLVSSLGIINTMTISLLERTHEIGIMKAIGASNYDIRKLFIFESALIGLIGGVAGVGIAVAFGSAFNFILNLLIQSTGQELDVFVTPVKFALVMIGIAALISTFAGIYPTSRAQKLAPIDALRQ